MPAIVPVLLYIGLVIGAQAFRAVPKAHYAAIVLAIVPNVAAWATGLINNTLAAAGTSAAELGSAQLAGAGVVYEGLLKSRLGRGAGRHGARRDRGLHDRSPLLWAGGLRVLRRALASIGLIHGEKVEFFADLEIALGYAFLGLVCLAFAAAQAARARARPRRPGGRRRTPRWRRAAAEAGRGRRCAPERRRVHA